MLWRQRPGQRRFPRPAGAARAGRRSAIGQGAWQGWRRQAEGRASRRAGRIRPHRAVADRRRCQPPGTSRGDVAERGAGAGTTRAVPGFRRAVPGIHLRFNEAMGDGEYLVQLQEVPVARGCLRPGWLLVRERAAQLELLAVPTSRRSRCREKRRAGWSRRIRIAWSVPAVPAWAWSRCSPGTCPMCCGSTPRISSASRRRATCWSRWSRVTASW